MVIASTCFMLVIVLMFVQIFWSITIGQIKLHFFGTVVPAQVTRIWNEPGPRGPSSYVAVAYRYDDTEYAQKLRISNAEAKALRVGDAFQVEVLAERPDQAVQYFEKYPFWFVTTVCCFLASIPTAAAGTALWVLLGVPWRLRSLLRRGEAATGVIVDRKEQPGRPPTYTLTYEFRPAARPWEGAAAPAVRATMRVWPEDFQGCQVGDQVVIVYHPARPRRSVIYRYADFEVVP
jgi:hypothetical protein